MATDPGKAKGDGIKMAMSAGKMKGKPAMPKDPGKAKGDGVAMAQGKRPANSKLSPSAGAKKKERN